MMGERIVLDRAVVERVLRLLFFADKPASEIGPTEAALRAALSAGMDGYVLVPREPTEAMLAACEAAWRTRVQDKATRGAFGENGPRGPFIENWRVMIAAASPPLPEPAQQGDHLVDANKVIGGDSAAGAHALIQEAAEFSRVKRINGDVQTAEGMDRLIAALREADAEMGRLRDDLDAADNNFHTQWHLAETAERQRDEAVAAFEEYGWHRASCSYDGPKHNCDCGFDALLAQIKGRGGE